MLMKNWCDPTFNISDLQIGELKSQTGLPKHRKPLPPPPNIRNTLETSLQRAPDQKSPQKVKLFTLALKNPTCTSTLHKLEPVSKKCQNLVVSWMGAHIYKVLAGYVPKAGEEKVAKIGHSKAPKKANAGEAIVTDCILTFVDRP